jgi:hypothetical protein
VLPPVSFLAASSIRMITSGRLMVMTFAIRAVPIWLAQLTSLSAKRFEMSLRGALRATKQSRTDEPLPARDCFASLAMTWWHPDPILLKTALVNY